MNTSLVIIITDCTSKRKIWNAKRINCWMDWTKSSKESFGPYHSISPWAKCKKYFAWRYPCPNWVRHNRHTVRCSQLINQRGLWIGFRFECPCYLSSLRKTLISILFVIIESMVIIKAAHAFQGSTGEDQTWSFQSYEKELALEVQVSYQFRESLLNLDP